MLLPERLVEIFDTAAGRVIARVVSDSDREVRVRRVALLDFKESKEEPDVQVPFLSPVLYAPDLYDICWSGVRGHVSAQGVCLEAYEAFEKEMSEAHVQSQQ